MTDIVSQNLISFDDIKISLINYVQSLPDYSTKWVDLYEGGPGQTMIELMAGVGTYLNLIALKSRREAYIDEAKLTSSIYGIATTIGYDVNRPTAPLYDLTVTCTNIITQDKDIPIGAYNSIPISLLENTTFQIGTNTVRVALGEWKSQVYTSNTSAPYTRFLIQDVIDNNLYSLTINGDLVQTIRASELLDTNNVLLRTYFYGMYIIFGDGIFGRPLEIGDVIEFDYFNPAPIATDSSFNLSNVTCNVGIVTAGVVVTYGSNQDSNEKIALVAPGYATAKRRLVTASDYKYVSLAYNGIISANFQKHPGICCTADVALIAENGRTLIPSEKTMFLNYMDGFQVLGTTVNLVDVVATTVSVKLIIVVTPTASQNVITSIITNYLNTMTFKLGKFFSISGLLNLNLNGVIGIYPQYPITDRQAAYNEFFTLSGVEIDFTTNVTSIKSFGSNLLLGYS